MIWGESPDCHMNHNTKQIIETLKITSAQENFEKSHTLTDKRSIKYTIKMISKPPTKENNITFI